MKVLREPKAIAQELAALAAGYPECRFALAVAPEEPLRRLLAACRDRVKQIVIGSDFLKAHPLRLDDWAGDARMRVVPPRASGSFHPMLHLFSDPGFRRWACLIARPNISGSAFELLGDAPDDETVVVISEQDDPAGWECERLRKSVERYWALGVPAGDAPSPKAKRRPPL